MKLLVTGYSGFVGKHLVDQLKKTEHELTLLGRKKPSENKQIQFYNFSLGDSSPELEYNQLCPPYPSCIEDYVGVQDTTNCN